MLFMFWHKVAFTVLRTLCRRSAFTVYRCFLVLAHFTLRWLHGEENL
jgi:hypothetical protein